MNSPELSGAEVGNATIQNVAGHPSASDPSHRRVTGDYDPNRIQRYRGRCACGAAGPWRVAESDANYDVWIHVSLLRTWRVA